MDGFADPRIGSAAAEISGHGVINIGIGWIWVDREERSRAHHLPWLAVTALRNLHLEPSSLHGMGAVI